jgi:ActR/RegA family two-component response regulator
MISFNSAATPARNRIFGFKFGDFFIEICRVLKKFADNDIDNALIIYVVANAAMQEVVESGLHTEELSDSDLVRLLSVRGVNISTVANTTRIDRATARRKLKKLEELNGLHSVN